MNKKLFFGMFAAASMLLATSCSNDELNEVQSGNEAKVTFSLGLENGIGSRTISDGTGAKKLICAIYDANNKVLNQVEINDKKVEKQSIRLIAISKIFFITGHPPENQSVFIIL